MKFCGAVKSLITCLGAIGFQHELEVQKQYRWLCFTIVQSETTPYLTPTVLPAMKDDKCRI